MSWLVASPAELLAAAAVGLAAVIVALGAAVFWSEQRSGRSATSSAGHPTPTTPRPARHAHLNAGELARLAAYRNRARLMAGESLQPAGTWRKVRYAWKEGYAGWVIACLAGSFSMATHFGAYWLIAGGGWPGAIAITLLSTGVMVWACAWVGLGLITGR